MSRLVLFSIAFLALILVQVTARYSFADNSVVATPSEHSTEIGGKVDGQSHKPAGDPKDAIIDFQIPLSVATFLVFLGLLFLLSKYAWGPISKALDDRERQHEESIAHADRARAEGERLLAEHRVLMSRAQDDIRGMMDEARKNAEKLGNSIVVKAQEEADASKQRAERDISHARDQALVEIWSQSANLAVDVAGKVLSREVTAEDHKRLLQRAIKELPANPSGERRS